MGLGRDEEPCFGGRKLFQDNVPGLFGHGGLEIVQHDKNDWRVGGIILPERHRDKGDEHERVMQKAEAGATFFTSQVVYNADSAIWFLRDYDELCKERCKRPARIIFTFAPFGREDTARFLKWLGVEIPQGTEKRVLSRKDVKARVKESVDICRENLKRILHACQYYNIDVPLGVTVESVSKYSDEFAGSVELFTVLKNEICESVSKS